MFRTPNTHLQLLILGIIALVLVSFLLLILALLVIPRQFGNLKERRRIAATRDDLEMQGTTVAATRRSYDSARDGFVETPVYGGGAGHDASLVSFAGFVEADIAEGRGSVDTLAGMEDSLSPRTMLARDNFVDVNQQVEVDGNRREEFARHVIGEDEPKGAAYEGEPEGVKRDFEEGVTGPLSPVGLGISGGLAVKESEIQVQLEMLEGRSSAEKIWSCEMVETFEGV